MSEQQQQNNIEIQLNDEEAQGIFANLAIINHTDAEFVMDFVYLQPNAPKGKVRSRVIMTPTQIKKFLLALQDNLTKFESKHGSTRIGQVPSTEDLQIQNP